MKVYAVHDFVRDAVHIYVELCIDTDGHRQYLTRGEQSDRGRVLFVEPGVEAPVYATLPRNVASEIAAAIECPLADEVVALDTWGDFAALVERALGGEKEPRPDDAEVPSAAKG
jgi:hypothetical protein